MQTVTVRALCLWKLTLRQLTGRCLRSAISLAAVLQLHPAAISLTDSSSGCELWPCVRGRGACVVCRACGNCCHDSLCRFVRKSAFHVSVAMGPSRAMPTHHLYWSDVALSGK